MPEIDDIKDDESLFSPNEKSLERRAASFGVFLALPTLLGIVNAQGAFIGIKGRWIKLNEWIQNRYTALTGHAATVSTRDTRSGAKVLSIQEDNFTSFRKKVQALIEKKNKAASSTKSTLLNETREAKAMVQEWLHGTESPFVTEELLTKETELKRKLGMQQSSFKTPQGTYERMGSYAERQASLQSLGTIKYIKGAGVVDKLEILRAAVLDLEIPSSYDLARTGSSVANQGVWYSRTTAADLIDPIDPATGVAKRGVDLQKLADIIEESDGYTRRLSVQIKQHVSSYARTGILVTSGVSPTSIYKGFQLAEPREIGASYEALVESGVIAKNPLKLNESFNSTTSVDAIKALLDDPHAGITNRNIQEVVIGRAEYSNLVQMNEARINATGQRAIHDASYTTRAQAEELSKTIKTYDEQFTAIKRNMASLHQRHLQGDRIATNELTYLAQKALETKAINSGTIPEYIKFIQNLEVSGKFKTILHGKIPFKTAIIEFKGLSSLTTIEVPMQQFSQYLGKAGARLSLSYGRIPFMKESGLPSNVIEGQLALLRDLRLMGPKLINDLKDSNYNTEKFHKTVQRRHGYFGKITGPKAGSGFSPISASKLVSESVEFLAGEDSNSFYRYLSRGVTTLQKSQQIIDSGAPLVIFDFEFNKPGNDPASGVQRGIKSGKNRVYWMSYTLKVGAKEEIFNYFIRPEIWHDIQANVQNFHVQHQEETGYRTFKEIEKNMKNAQKVWDLDPTQRKIKAVGPLTGATHVSRPIHAFIDMARNIYSNTSNAVHFLGQNILEADLIILNQEIERTLQSIESGVIQKQGVKVTAEEKRLLQRFYNDTKIEKLLATGRALDTHVMGRALFANERQTTRYGLQDLFDKIVTIEVDNASVLKTQQGRDAWFSNMTNAVKSGNAKQRKALLGDLPSSIQGSMKNFITQATSKPGGKQLLLHFFDKSIGSHHMPLFDQRLAFHLWEMETKLWERMQRFDPETANTILSMGEHADREMKGGAKAWHHNLSTRAGSSLFEYSDNPDVITSDLFGVTPVQATRGRGSFVDLKTLIPFGALSNFQKQKYQATVSTLMVGRSPNRAKFKGSEDFVFDALKHQRVPDAFPILDKRMLSTMSLSKSHDFFTQIQHSAGFGMKDTTLRRSFPAMTMFLPSGSRMVAEDMALFTNKEIMKATFNLPKDITVPLSVPTQGLHNLLHEGNNLQLKRMTLTDYMRAGGYSEKIISMIEEKKLNTSMATFIDSQSSFPIYNHQEAIEFLQNTKANTHRILAPGEIMLEAESAVAVEYGGKAKTSIQNQVRNVMRHNTVLTSIQYQHETGEILFNGLAGGTPGVVKMVGANKQAKSMFVGTAANTFVGKGVQIIAGWKGDQAALLHTQIERAALQVYRRNLPLNEQRKIFKNIFMKAFGLSEEAVEAAVEFQESKLHSEQIKLGLFGKSDTVIVPRLIDQTVLQLQHPEIFRYMSEILREAGVTYKVIKQNFKKMFTDISQELKVDFTPRSLDRLADTLIQKQQEQIESWITAQGFKAGDPKSIQNQWLDAVRIARRDNVALFDIGVLTDKGQLKTALTQYAKDQKIEGKLKTIELFDQKGKLNVGMGKILEAISLEPTVLITVPDWQIMEDQADFGKLKGLQRDVWGNPVSSSSQIWQMMMHKKVFDANPLYMEHVFADMLSDAGWSNPVVTNKIKSNRHILATMKTNQWGHITAPEELIVDKDNVFRIKGKAEKLDSTIDISKLKGDALVDKNKLIVKVTEYKMPNEDWSRIEIKEWSMVNDSWKETKTQEYIKSTNTWKKIEILDIDMKAKWKEVKTETYSMSKAEWLKNKTVPSIADHPLSAGWTQEGIPIKPSLDIPTDIHFRKLTLAKMGVDVKAFDIMMKTGLTGELTGKLGEVIGNIRDFSGKNVEQILSVLEASFKSEEYSMIRPLFDDIVSEIYSMQGIDNIRTMTLAQLEKFNIFDAPISGAGIVELPLPDIDAMLRDPSMSSAQRKWLESFRETQTVQTARAQFYRQVYTKLEDRADEGAKRELVKQQRLAEKMGIVPRELIEGDINRIPEKYRGALTSIQFADVQGELPPRIQKEFYSVGISHQKLLAEKSIIKWQTTLIDLLKDVEMGDNAARDALATAEHSYTTLIDRLSGNFVGGPIQSMTQALHSANKFYHPAFYGKLADSTLIMTQGFGQLVEKLEQSKKLLDSYLYEDSPLMDYLKKEQPKITYKELVGNLLGLKVDKATDLSAAMYRIVNGKRTLIGRGTGLLEGIISHSELLKQLRVTTEGEGLSYLKKDPDALRKVLAGKEWIYSTVIREPSFPSPLGALHIRTQVLPDEVFGMMGLGETVIVKSVDGKGDTIKFKTSNNFNRSTFWKDLHTSVPSPKATGMVNIGTAEILAMLGDRDGDLAKMQFTDVSLRATPKELREMHLNQAQKFKRWIAIKLGEEGADALTYQGESRGIYELIEEATVDSENKAFFKEHEGRYLAVIAPDGLSDTGFGKIMKSIHDPLWAKSLATRAETYSVMQAITPHIGAQAKRIGALFEGTQGAMSQYIDKLSFEFGASHSEGELLFKRNFLAEHGYESAPMDNAQVRREAGRLYKNYAGAWGTLNKEAAVFSKDPGGKLFPTNVKNIERFTSWMSALVQKVPIQKSKTKALRDFKEATGYLNRLMQGSIDANEIEALTSYYTSKTNVIEGSRYDLMGLPQSESDLIKAKEGKLIGSYYQSHDITIIQKSNKKSAAEVLGSVIKLMYGFSKSPEGLAMHEMSKKTPNPIYGWAVETMGDDMFVHPEISALISPSAARMTYDAEGRGLALAEALSEQKQAGRIFTETITKKGSDFLNSLFKSNTARRTMVGALAFLIFDPNVNSILLPNQQADGEKYDIPNIDEIARSYKNRFKTRETKPYVLDKIAHLTGLPVNVIKRNRNSSGLPPMPNKVRYERNDHRKAGYSSLQDFRRQINSIL